MKVRVVGEVVVLAMLENKHSAILQQVVAENEVGDCRQFGKSIRGVGKDEV